MPLPYIPTKDTDLDNWLANFSTLITASPGTYGLITADALAIAAAVTNWSAAYTAAINPPTRTPVSVAAKDVEKINVLAIARPYAQTISLNAGVAVDDKIAVGVNPRTSTPTPIPTPTSVPVISLISATFLQHLLRFRDEGAPATSRSKPFGVLQMQLFAAASTVLVTDPSILPLKAVATKVPVVVAWDSSDRGKTAYYAARWITRTGLAGPWSDILSIIVT